MQLSGLALSMGIKPAVESFFSYLFAGVLYVQTPDASGSILLTSLVASILFILINIVVMLVASAFYLGKVQKIFQRRLHERVVLGAHRSFWIWGTAGLVMNLALPLVFAEIIDPILSGPLMRLCIRGEDLHWTAYFLSGPLVLVLGFLVVYVAAQGLRAMLFIKRYKPESQSAPFDDVTEPRIIRGRLETIQPR
jgi:hypothetical protein